MHARDTTTEKELDTVLQMTVEQVLIQRFKQSPKCTTKRGNIRKSMKMLQNQEIPLESCFILKFYYP